MEEVRQQGVEDTTFTPKSGGIEELMASMTGRAREAGHCVMEDKLPEQEHSLEFNDPLSRKEYSISGLCQTCQDAVFGEGEEEEVATQEVEEMIQLLTDMLGALEYLQRADEAAYLILKHITLSHLKEFTEMCPHLTLAMASYFGMRAREEGKAFGEEE